MGELKIEFGRYRVTATRRDYTVNPQDPTAAVEWKGTLKWGPHELSFKLNEVWGTVGGNVDDRSVQFNLEDTPEYPSDAEVLWELLEDAHDNLRLLDHALTTEEERAEDAARELAELAAGWNREP